jgi:Tol biopolymer transport system component
VKRKYFLYTVISVVLAATAFAIDKSTACSTTLTTLARERRCSFLLYAHISNRILLVDQEAVRSIDTTGSRQFLGHPAYPSISGDGRSVAFIRPSNRPEAEDIVLYDVVKREESVLLTWRGRISSVAWSPRRTHIAFVGDKEPQSSRDFFIIDVTTHELSEIAEGASVYASPAWSRLGDRIAFARDSRTRDGNIHEVLIARIATKETTKIGDGWVPSWSPDGNRIAYIDPNHSRCYQVDISNNSLRLMWWSLRSILLDDDIIGPAAWSPSGEGVLFNITSGMKDDGRDGYYMDLASGKKCRVRHDSVFDVVGWVRKTE